MIYATFIGNSSMGFKKGVTYTLRTEIKSIPGVKTPCLCVYDIHSGAWCPYDSLESFLKNWKLCKND